MEPTLDFSKKTSAELKRGFMRWVSCLRYAALLIIAGASAGCADDVVMKNPQTGQPETCQESLRGFNPWSQATACVANHEAQGWTRVSQQ